MEFELKKWLKDILICIENIDNYLGKETKYQDYESNLLLQDAVERNLITIRGSYGVNFEEIRRFAYL